MQHTNIFDSGSSLEYPHSPAYRRVDTSKDAAGAVTLKAKTVRDLVLGALKRHHSGMTTEELSEHLIIPYHTVQPRTSELKRQGKIHDSGLRRPHSITAKNSIVWKFGEG